MHHKVEIWSCIYCSWLLARRSWIRLSSARPQCNSFKCMQSRAFEPFQIKFLSSQCDLTSLPPTSIFCRSALNMLTPQLPQILLLFNLIFFIAAVFVSHALDFATVRQSIPFLCFFISFSGYQFSTIRKHIFDNYQCAEAVLCRCIVVRRCYGMLVNSLREIVTNTLANSFYNIKSLKM